MTHTTPARRLLIFTDLDGSLLDHNTYSFEPAIPVLEALKTRHVPVICCTSKTFAELLPLREQLQNHYPFIVENGAAVYLPTQDFPHLADSTASPHAGYLCQTFSKPRAHWQQCLDQLPARLQQQFVRFSQLGIDGICAATSLGREQATQANQREFSEPLQWLGSDSDKTVFIEAMHQLGANILQGGRFLHVSGDCDKGRALLWLKTVYQQQYDQAFTSIAAGDSHNDIAMLEAADKALIIRSPAHEAPQLQRADALLSTAFGPAGWAEGISRLIEED